jgi:archaellum component FlaC
MDFKLFGRLKDDDEGGGDSSGENNPQNQSINEVGGGNLGRTVESMFNQGYSEDEIKSELRGQYSSEEISRAINNAVTSSATGGDQNQGGPEPMSPYQGEDEAVSPMDEGYDDDQNQNQPQNQQQQSQGQQQQTQQQQQAQQVQQKLQGGQGQPVDPQVEELIETIIAENFQKVEKEFQNVYSELDVIEDKLEDLENRVHDLEVRDDEDQQKFVEKMDEIEDHIDSYESRIGGLEKAFQQMLPSLVDNIRDLTSLVQEIKQEQGIETQSSVNQQEVEDIDMDAFKEE